jgi:hypothetical protein
VYDALFFFFLFCSFIHFLSLSSFILFSSHLFFLSLLLPTINASLWELKECLHINFSSFMVAHKSRSCNLVVQSLAALGAKLCPGTNPIMDSIPPCINVPVANDLASGFE